MEEQIELNGRKKNCTFFVDLHGNVAYNILNNVPHLFVNLVMGLLVEARLCFMYSRIIIYR